MAKNDEKRHFWGTAKVRDLGTFRGFIAKIVKNGQLLKNRPKRGPKPQNRKKNAFF
jgi:hypothetical protein